MDDVPIITIQWPRLESEMRGIELKLKCDRESESYRQGRIELERFVDETMRSVQIVQSELQERCYSAKFDTPEIAVKTIQRMIFIARMLKYDPSAEVRRTSVEVKERQLYYLHQVYTLMRLAIINYGDIEFYKRWEPIDQ